jgi:hypothetical protein
MKFKVTKIAAAVAAGLGVSVAGMNAAQADSVFFPYLIASPAVTTILSVMDEGNAGGADMHYRYYYKKDLGDAERNRLSFCREANYPNASSNNDIVTFDIANVFGDGDGVLFEPTTNRYDDFAIFREAALEGGQAIRANAVIDNDINASETDDTVQFGRNVTGEAFIIEFANGAVWGYQAYNAAEIYAANVPPAGAPPVEPFVVNSYDFSDRSEVDGEVLVQPAAGLTQAEQIEKYRVPIAVMPLSEVTTRLFVTPVQNVKPFQTPIEKNLYAAGVRLEVNDNTTLQQVMFDRDENPVSGRVTKNVVCVGAVDVPEMVSEAIRSRVVNGGWTNVGITLGTVGATLDSDTGAASTAAVNVNQATVMKLEYGITADGTLGGKPYGAGAFNNGFWLRKGIRESVVRDALLVAPGSPTAWPALPVFDLTGRGVPEVNSSFPVLDATKMPVDSEGQVIPPAPNATASQAYANGLVAPLRSVSVKQ